jgi:hypothetical protein
MSLATVWLLIVALAAVAIVVAIALTVVDAIRLGGRLGRRVKGYSELPVLAQASRADGDIARIEAALRALAALGLALRRLPRPAKPRLF